MQADSKQAMVSILVVISLQIWDDSALLQILRYGSEMNRVSNMSILGVLSRAWQYLAEYCGVLFCR